MLKRTLSLVSAAATILLLCLVGDAVAGKGGGKGGGNGGGGGGEEPEADPAVAFVVLSGSDVSGTLWATGDLWVMDADGSNKMRVLAAECGRAGWSRDMDLDTDGYQGELAFGSTVQGHGLYRIKPDGTGLTKILSLPFMPTRVDWSPVPAPDGDYKIAFQAHADSDGDGEPDRNDVFLVNEDGTGLVNLTDSTDAAERAPSWSPDATRLAFTETVSGDGDAFVVEFGVAGGDLVVLSKTNVTATGPLASRDVRWTEWARLSDRLVVDDAPNGFVDLWVIDVADASSPENITADYEQILNHTATPTWSPDDSEILFSALTDSKSVYPFVSLFLVAVDGSSKTEVVRGGRGKNVPPSAPSWRR